MSHIWRITVDAVAAFSSSQIDGVPGERAC